MDLGSELRHARERLGLSIGEIADRTKIRPAILRAIENDDLERLPPPIFTRGFLKAYAREVGLDPEALWQRYADALQRMDEARRAAAPAAVDTTIEDRSPAFPLGSTRSSLETAALIVMAGLLIIVLNRWQAPDETAPRREGSDSPRAAATQGETNQDDAVATTGSPHATAAVPVGGRGLMRVELLPQGLCWIEATADGNRIIYRLLNAGDRYAIEGHDELILRVGDPAQFAFTIDGATGRSLGPAGRPATVRITRATAHSFIAAR